MNKKQENLSFTDSLLLALSDLTDDFSKLMYPRIVNDVSLYPLIPRYNYNKKVNKKNFKQKYNVTLNNLKRCHYLIIKKGKKGIRVSFTNKGIIRLLRLKWKLKNRKVKSKSKKDCLIVFDVPEKRRNMRDLLRLCLYDLGFSQLQKSVFIGDEDMVYEIKQLIDICELRDMVKIFIAEKI